MLWAKGFHQSIRHDGYGSGRHFAYLATRNPYFRADSSGQNDFIWRVFLYEAAILDFFDGGDTKGFKASDKTQTRIEDRLQQITLRANLADAGQIGADIPSQIPNGMAGPAGGLLAVEERLAPADVPAFHACHQLINVSVLLLGVFVEEWIEFCRLSPNRFRKISQTGLDRLNSQAPEGLSPSQ